LIDIYFTKVRAGGAAVRDEIAFGLAASSD
jgi:hypothetical protein